jgi:hypothetical protein
LRYLLEEAYEAAGAIETGDLAALREETSDVMSQALVARAREPAAIWSCAPRPVGLVRERKRARVAEPTGKLVSGAIVTRGAIDWVNARLLWSYLL